MVSAVLGTAEEAEEQGIHYMLLDVCLTCLTWPTLFPAMAKASTARLPDEVKLAADALMDYLVRLVGFLVLWLPILPAALYQLTLKTNSVPHQRDACHRCLHARST